MKITIFGSGYVGLVTGACLAEVGNDVLCMDVDQAKIEGLKQGRVPIYEPGLDALIARNARAGRLQFTSDVVEAVDHGLFLMIAVGTPPDEDGSADLSHVLAVAKSIGDHMKEFRVVITKSTVPVGTSDKVAAAVSGALEARKATCEFDVVSNPEFLKEGAAIDDCMRPDRIVVGCNNPRTTELLRVLYAPFNRNHNRLLEMDVRSAELTKYAANAMLAAKISFMNEVSNIADRLGADVEKVRVGIGSDPRIGYHFIYPGCGFGGSCFPKDVRALEQTARQMGYQPDLLHAVLSVNERQKEVLFDKITHHFDNRLQGRCFALWGLAFKPNTDDMREASSRVLLEKLWQAGARVRAFDPVAMDEAQRIYGDRDDLVLCETAEAALDGVDALIIVTEWNVFRSPDFSLMKNCLAHKVVFDGRNLYDPQVMARQGLTYYSIGRPVVETG